MEEEKDEIFHEVGTLRQRKFISSIKDKFGTGDVTFYSSFDVIIVFWFM